MSLVRRSLQVVALVCTLIVGAASLAVIVTQTTWFKEWLRGFIVRQAEDYVNGTLSIGRLGGNLFYGVELEDVDVTVNGETVVGIKDVGVNYNAFSLIAGHIVLDSIRVNQPVVRLEQDAEGWNLTRLIKARTPDPDEPKSRQPIEIGEIGISDGTVHLTGVGTSGIDAPATIERLDASLAVKSDENELRVDIKHVSLRTSEPSIGINSLSGVIRRSPNTITLENVSLRTEETALMVNGTVAGIEGSNPTLDITASSDKMTVSEIARLVPALRGYEMQPAIEVTAKGPLDALAVDVAAREKTLGAVAATLKVDAAAPGRRVAGDVSMEHFNVGSVIPVRTESGATPATPIASDITGRGTIDFALPEGQLPLSGTYQMEASRVQVAGYEARNVRARGRIDGTTVRVDASAAAYGGRATTMGTVTAGGPLALNLSGHASNLDLRNLPASIPAPRVPGTLQFDYSIVGRGPVFSGEVRLGPSTLASAVIADGATATFRVGDGAPVYAAKGAVSNLDVQAIGQAFSIDAIAADRFRSQITSTFDVSGSGGGRYPLALTASGVATDSTMFGASFPRLEFATDLMGGDAVIKATGQFAHLDPAVVSTSEQAKGDLTGDLDVNTTLRGYTDGVTADSIDLSGRITLAPSTIAGMTIDSARVDGTYANREGNLNELSIMGPDITVEGQGPVALNETGNSNLTLHLASPTLARIGELVKQPIKGTVDVNATVTGNARELTAQGTLKGGGIGYADNDALALDTAFTAVVPDLDAARASVKAQSTATFLRVGGQEINELKADTTYAASMLEFDAVAKQGERELEAGGTATFRPDQQEVRLGKLALRAEMVEWRTEAGREATVQYGQGRIAVQDLRLVNADQSITAEGVFGSTTESLQVKVENVDVSQVDRLLLGDQRLAGRFTANATVTGPTDAPEVKADFSLSPGAFRQFTFESFAGTAAYGGSSVTMDIRLQQNPQSWLTATGKAPLTLFRGNPPELATGEPIPPAPGEEVDIDIASSQIDLGVVQGFTSYVTNVTGTLQANVKVSGSGYDPRFDGAIDIAGGAFTLPDLGTAYTGFDTRIELASDVLTIRQMQLVDEHDKVLTVGGTLAVKERAVGNVNVQLKSEDFEVIDNPMADLKLDTDIRVTGTIRAPKIEGFVEVETGTINIQEVLNFTTGGPYATQAADLTSAAAITAGSSPGNAPVPPQSAPPATSGSPVAEARAEAAAEAAVAPGDVDAPQAEAAPVVAMPSLFSAMDLNVGLAIPSNLVIRGADIRPANAPIELGDMVVTVGGAVQVRKAPGETLVLTGEVNTVRGTYTFQGRRFEILRDGRIRLAGTDELDPVLDLRASRIISGVETFIRVQGTMRMPELSFSSNPPLDQADILSLIVFNAPINELGEGQQVSLSQRAAALAGGYLTSGLARSIGNALELDEFEIQAAGDNGGGPQISVGEQVGERLFFRIRQGFGAQQATEFILEYQIRDYLRLQGTVADAGSGAPRTSFRRVERGGLDLIFFFNY